MHGHNTDSGDPVPVHGIVEYANLLQVSLRVARAGTCGYAIDDEMTLTASTSERGERCEQRLAQTYTRDEAGVSRSTLPITATAAQLSVVCDLPLTINRQAWCIAGGEKLLSQSVSVNDGATTPGRYFDS